MHKFAKQIMECVKTKVEAMGIDNVEGQHLEELGKWVDIIKDIACYDKDMRIIKAMDEAEENEEKIEYIEEYEDYPEMEMRRGYRGQPRDSRGRYMSRRGRGGRRGYEEPWDEMYDEMEYYRDMDRPYGKMYYSGGVSSSGGGSDMIGGRDGREGRSGQMRRGYMEAKEMGKDKQEKMKELENYMKTMAEDLTEAIEGASPEERSLAKQKLSLLVSKM